MASKTDLAWAAGIIDGEGSILMTHAHAGVNRRTTPSFQIRISVRMTHKKTIYRLGRIFGGVVRPGSRVIDPKRHKPAWEWYVGDLKTETVLKRIVRFMTTKRHQAILVLEFRRTCFPKLPRGRGVECPPDLVRLREAYFRRLHKLNKKGPA